MKMGRWRQNLRKDSFFTVEQLQNFWQHLQQHGLHGFAIVIRIAKTMTFLDFNFQQARLCRCGRSLRGDLIVPFWSDRRVLSIFSIKKVRKLKECEHWKNIGNIIGMCWSISKSDLNFWFSWKSKKWVLTQVTPITVVSPSGVARATNQQPHSKFVRSRSTTLKMYRGTKMNLKSHHQDFNENPFPWDHPRLKVESQSSKAWNPMYHWCMSPTQHVSLHVQLCASCRFVSRQRQFVFDFAGGEKVVV